MSQKTVQIPWQLFRDIYVYFEYGDGDPEKIRRQLNAKMDKLQAHYEYSRTKAGDKEYS